MSFFFHDITVRCLRQRYLTLFSPRPSRGLFHAAAVSYAFSFFATGLAEVPYAFFFCVSYVFCHFVPKSGRKSVYVSAKNPGRSLRFLKNLRIPQKKRKIAWWVGPGTHPPSYLTVRKIGFPLKPSLINSINRTDFLFHFENAKLKSGSLWTRIFG